MSKWINVAESIPLNDIIVWVRFMNGEGELIARPGYNRDGHWRLIHVYMDVVSAVPEKKVISWQCLWPPDDELDADNPLPMGHGDFVTKVDAYLLGVNAMFKVVEMLAKTARGEGSDA